ncbi:MAG: type II toxin-antitoxin system VapC family toxin, partial [Dehalococcoidia bacterium]
MKWVLPEPGRAAAMRLRSGAARGNVELLAPDVVVAEVANAIWQRSHLRGEFSHEEARDALSTLLDAMPPVDPSAPLIPQALELAFAHRQAVYDCIYVALAQRAGCPLVTADGPLVRSMSGA